VSSFACSRHGLYKVIVERRENPFRMSLGIVDLSTNNTIVIVISSNNEPIESQEGRIETGGPGLCETWVLRRFNTSSIKVVAESQYKLGLNICFYLRHSFVHSHLSWCLIGSSVLTSPISIEKKIKSRGWSMNFTTREWSECTIRKRTTLPIQFNKLSDTRARINSKHGSCIYTTKDIFSTVGYYIRCNIHITGRRGDFGTRVISLNNRGGVEFDDPIKANNGTATTNSGCRPGCVVINNGVVNTSPTDIHVLNHSGARVRDIKKSARQTRHGATLLATTSTIKVGNYAS